MAKPYAKAFYRSKEWQAARSYRLMTDKYICQDCGAPAEEVHHIIHLTAANIYDPKVALSQDNLVSLCRDCHFRRHREDAIARMRKLNHDRVEGRRILNADGTYFDDNGMMCKREVYIVYGSPRSGKSTYVRDHMTDGDCVIDIDAIISALQYSDTRKAHNNLRFLAIDIRDFLITQLEDESRDFDCKHVWIIGGFPTRKERATLKDKLNATLIYVDAPREVCERRAMECDAYDDKNYSVDIVRKWWDRFEP